MFRAVSPSIIKSLRLYIQHQVYVIQVLWLLATKQPQNLCDIYLMMCVLLMMDEETVLNM
jgi:hypothetical protein